MVWGQNWFWKSGAPLLATIPDRYKAWSVKRDLKKAIGDPMIQATHRNELAEAYSKSQTDNLKRRLAEIQDSL